MTSYGVRRALLADAEALGQVHTRVWREAYAGLMSPDYLAGLDPAASTRRWQQLLTAPADGRRCWVGTADDDVVGFATTGPSRDEPAEPAHELYAINVLAAHHGTGVASRLFENALRRGAGDAAVSLWVAEDNARARAFYARYGFAADGRRKTHESSGIDEIRLVRPAPG